MKCYRNNRLTSDSSTTTTTTSAEEADDRSLNDITSDEQDRYDLIPPLDIKGNNDECRRKYELGHQTLPETKENLSNILQGPIKDLERRKKTLSTSKIDTMTPAFATYRTQRGIDDFVPPHRDTENAFDDRTLSSVSTSKLFNDGDEETEQDINQHRKSNPQTCCSSCFHNLHFMNPHCERNLQEQCECDENQALLSAEQFRTTERNKHCPKSYAQNQVTDATAVKADVIDELNTDCRITNDKCTDCRREKERLDGGTKDLSTRNGIPNDYQFLERNCQSIIEQKLGKDYTELNKLRANYNSLRKLFLTLAVLNIVLIVCVVSVMPVILLTFKMSNDQGGETDKHNHLSAEYLHSREAKDIVKEHVFCVKCESVKPEWSEMFTRESHKGCCLQDVVLFAEEVIEYAEKRVDESESRIKAQLKRQNEWQDEEIVQIKNSCNSSWNGSKEIRICRDRQSVKNSHLINKLLTRKRSAVHLTGTISFTNGIEWTQKFPLSNSNNQGNIGYHNNRIEINTGGVFFLYSCVRFKAGLCDSKQHVGYQISTGYGKQEVVVASVQQSCVNGTNSGKDLTIQQVVNIPADRETLYIKVSASNNLVAKEHKHSFGLFEI